MEFERLTESSLVGRMASGLAKYGHAIWSLKSKHTAELKQELTAAFVGEDDEEEEDSKQRKSIISLRAFSHTSSFTKKEVSLTLVNFLKDKTLIQCVRALKCDKFTMLVHLKRCKLKQE